MIRVELEVREHNHEVGLGLRIILCIICTYRGLFRVVDDGCLLLVICGSGVDQGGVVGPETPPSGRAWSEDHFDV